MLWTSIKRICKAGFINFWRNGFISLSSVFVMTIALFVIGMMVFSTAILKTALSDLKNKADINVYFVTTASEDEIKAVEKSLKQLPEVASVTYTSRDEAFKIFKERHQNDESMTQVFDILGDNPLGASLTIKAKEVSQYESIANFLTKDNTVLSAKDGASIIDDVNYFRNKIVIEKLSNIIGTGERAGLLISILFVAIAILITFNTIRLAIYNSKEEIAIMKLVGASNKYIRGPFVVSGIMYGLISAVLTMVIFYGVTFWINQSAGVIWTGFNLFKYYLANFSQIFTIVFLSGIFLGAVSSFLAVRRHLKV